jgi:hypothetical protein
MSDGWRYVMGVNFEYYAGAHKWCTFTMLRHILGHDILYNSLYNLLNYARSDDG